MVKLSILHDIDFSYLLCECFSWYTRSEITIIRSGRYRQSICLGRSFSVRLPPFIASFAILNRISGTDSLLMSTLHHLWDTHKLTYWGRVTYIWVGNLTIIGSNNGLSPDRRQASIWPNARILLIAPLGTNFSEILNGIQTFSVKKMHLKMSSAKWRPFCLGLNVLRLNESVFIEQATEHSFGVAELHFVIAKARDISVSVSCISTIIANLRQIVLVSTTGALAW